MDNINQKVRRHRISLICTLTILFIMLKLFGVVNWAWVLVFSPVWITLLFFVLLFGFILVGGRIIKGKW